MLNNKSILITGGTGSFGSSFVSYIINKYKNIKRLVILSRDELKQFEMARKFEQKKIRGLRFFIGDVRDKDRIKRALNGIDIVIHAAALKQVPAAEYNPIEFIKTNILGAQNIIEASLDCGVKKVIALSTDKASAPINLYGATKLCSDKLFIAANNYSGRRTVFSVVRYGNVMGSRGSVFPEFINQSKNKKINITDKNMTRFNITLNDSIRLVLFAIENSSGGEMFVPKLPSYNILDLAKAVAPHCKINFIGLRPGEKIHEEMINIAESSFTYDIGKCYVVLPSYQKLAKLIIQSISKKFNMKKVNSNFSLSSGDNKKFLRVQEIRELIIKNLDKNFKPL